MKRALWVVLSLLLSCTYAMEDVRFRTNEPDTAFDRAAAAVEEACHGVKLADRERMVIFSHWQAWHTGDGVYLGRCMVSMVYSPDDRGTDVRVAMAMKQCPLADLSDLDALSERCALVTIVPSIVADQLSSAAQRIEAAVRR